MLLEPHLWPDQIAACVKSVKRGPFGTSITLVDTLMAQRVVLEPTGKLKSTGNGFDGLAAALRADIERNAREE